MYTVFHSVKPSSACTAASRCAVARAAGAAEGQVDLGAGGAVVDVDDARRHVRACLHGLVDVLRVDGAGQAVMLSLLIAMASSRLSTGMMTATGPKISSCATMRMSGRTSANSVGL